MELEIVQLEDYLSYNSETNAISYTPKKNDGFALIELAGNSIIVIKLLDDRGNENSFKTSFNFFEPLMFDSYFNSTLPDFIVTAG